jgi:hypothetical protein
VAGNVMAGARTMKVTRLHITDAGQQAVMMLR